MLNKDEIKESLLNRNYKVIHVIKCINYSFHQNGEPFEEEELMDNSDINRVFEGIKENMINKNILNFLIFNEFFFSYHRVISNENFNLIIDLAKNITRIYPNLVIIINLLHEIEPESFDMNKYLSDCKTYFTEISDKENNIIWNISSKKFDVVFKNNNKNYYSNETFVIMRNNILYKYKKSTYFEELNGEEEYNYTIGFGNDEMNYKLEDDLFQIGKILSENISIEICYDLQNNIKSKSFDNITEEIPGIKELKKLRENVVNYDKKQLIIIQSNTTNVYEQLDIFPLKKIISKCDPKQQLVFTLNNKENIKEINYSQIYNTCQINHQKNLGNIPDTKLKRLDKYLFNLNHELETYNVHKLINEFKSEISKLDLGNHLIMICEYDIFQNNDLK